MEEKHKYILQKNRRLLLNDLDVNNINNYLIQEFVFTPDLMSKVLSKATRLERVEFLLDMLPSQGERTFYVFLDALQTTYPHLYEALLLDDHMINGVTKQPVQCSEVPGAVAESSTIYVPERHLATSNETFVDNNSRQLISPNARVTEKDLARIAAKLSGDFSILAGMLGLTSAELYQSQVQHQHSVKDQYFAILYTWRRKSGYGATNANLVRILQDINVDCSVYASLLK